MARRIRHEQYDTHHAKLAAYAKALAHPARVAIMEHLHQVGGCFCGDIVNTLPIAQASVSQHLKELREAGLIIASDEPPKVKYCINRQNWEEAKKHFCRFFDHT